MSTTIDQYLVDLEVAKQDIKDALEEKGVTVTGGLSSYGESVMSIQTINDLNVESLNETITRNGNYSFGDDNTYYNEVNISVNVSGSSSDKPKIYNGFRFTSGDISLVDFSQYDWSSVYDTSYFFNGCSHSTGDWSNFEQNFNGDVVSGYNMFYNCSFTSIPQLNTNLVADMSYMFQNCSQLTTIPQLDTSLVMDMSYMFHSCTQLTTIPLLDTSSVSNMSNMFNNCCRLISIPQLDTSLVMDMSYMFKSCSRLISIPQLDTSSVTNMSYMFQNCSQLTTIPQLDTSSATDMRYMFNGCTSLTTIPQLDTSSVTNMNAMFGGCNRLISIPQLDTSSVTNMSYMFSSCSSLTTIPQLDTSSVTDMSNMFNFCSNLIIVRFKGNPSQVVYTGSLFNNTANNGTLYYDDRYDYSKIINVLPSTWVAIPYNVEEYESNL